MGEQPIDLLFSSSRKKVTTQTIPCTFSSKKLKEFGGDSNKIFILIKISGNEFGNGLSPTCKLENLIKRSQKNYL